MKLLNPLFIILILFTGSLFSQEAAGESKGGEVKKDQFKRQEVIVIDSTAASELLKRAVDWVKTESNRFKKTNGVTTGSKAECIAVFPIKPKELNPVSDYTGTLSMHVSIECKDNKYRYVITKIKHTSTSGQTSGGDINNLIPECGSMAMPDLVWKKIKGEAIRSSEMVVSEIKEHMMFSKSPNKDEW